MTDTITLLASQKGFNPMDFLPIILMVIIFWVIIIRPQQKKRKDLEAKLNKLKKGDDVVTIGGMHATVNSISEKSISLRIAEGVFVKYDKAAIATVFGKGDEKKK